jgi:SOS response regulatory protein OraA/RecX
LVRDLQAQGVDRRIAEEAVRSSFAADDVDPTRVVRALAEKRAGQLAGLPVAVRKRRLVAFLARRGFGGADVRALVETLAGR